MFVFIKRKSGGLSLVLVLMILQIILLVPSVFANNGVYHYGTACGSSCTSVNSASSCGIPYDTTQSYDNFPWSTGNNCIYRACGTSACGSTGTLGDACDFGACEIGFCAISGVPQSASLVRKNTGCPSGQTWTDCTGQECRGVTCIGGTGSYKKLCDSQGGIALIPDQFFFNPNPHKGQSGIGRDMTECTVDLADNKNKLTVANPYGGYFSYKVDGTAGTGSLVSFTTVGGQPSASINTATLAVSGKRIVTELKMNSIDFTLANPCVMQSYFPGTASYTSVSLDCLYAPSSVAGCCAYTAPSFKLNTNNIVKATTGTENGRWYFCADTSLDKQTVGTFTTYWRYSANSRYRFDRINFSKSSANAPILEAAATPFHDIIATDYVGDNAYGWLVCKTDGFYTSNNVKLTPSSNILKSISSTLPQVTVEDVLGTGTDGALVSTAGSTMSLKDFLKMLGGVTVGSPSIPVNVQTPEVFYADSSYISDLTYYSEGSYSNEKTIDKLQGSIVVDPTDMKLRKDSSNRVINNEPLFYGRKFPMDKRYYDISIRDSVANTIFNSRDHISFRKDSTGSRFTMDLLADKAFTVQSDNPATLEDESGYLKPVYIILDEFSNENNKGKSYDVILHFCSNKNSIVTGVYGDDCVSYTYSNLLRVGFVVDDKSTLASSAFYCKDNKIYECCGRNFYCMNKEMLGNTPAENLAKTFADGDPMFKSLRRSSQFIDVVYDPDFEVVNVSQRDNEIRFYTDTNLAFTMSNPTFLFKKELDGNKFTNLEFDFFTYFALSGNVKVCLKSGKTCCQNITQAITPRVFEHIVLPISGFDCYDSTTKTISVTNLQVYASKRSSRDYIKNCILSPPVANNECNNLFVLDRFFVSKAGDPSYFCGSNRTWLRDFDLDPIACDDTPGMYWAGGSPNSADPTTGLVANNKNCCGDDPGETWENPNENGACVNGRYLFNNQRYMDSYRLTESEVTPANNIDYAQVLAYDGKLYGCNINGITVGTKVFTVNSGSGDTLDGSVVTTTIVSSPETSKVAFKGADFNLASPVMVDGVKQCSTKGSFYCSPRNGWRKDAAKDDISAATPGNERIGYSDIASDITGATTGNMYLLDASEDQLQNLSDRSGELDGCCPVGWCWNGFSCTQNQRGRSNDWLRLMKDDGDNTPSDSDQFYRCVDGVWTNTPVFKKTWQSKDTLPVPEENIRELNYNPVGVSGTTNGFCPRASDCLVNPSIPSNRYNRSFDYLGNNRCDITKRAENTICTITDANNQKTTGYINKGNCTVSGLRMPTGSYSTGVCTVTKSDSTKITGVIGISSQSARGQDFLNDYLKKVMTESGTRLYDDIELYKFPNIQDVQCIPSGYYIGDYFCGKDSAGNGKWTSRTEIMFEQLSNFTKQNGINDKYSIHCGNLEEVFNTRPEFSNPAEYNNKGCVLRGNCTGGYCPIDHTISSGFSVFALELNSKNSAMITSMKTSKDMRRPFGQSFYDQFNTNAGMFSYYDAANIIFVSKDIAIPNGIGRLDIYNFFQRILNFFTGLIPGSNQFKPSTYLQSYYVVDKIYFAKSGSRTIFASSGYDGNSEVLTKVIYSGFTAQEITDIKTQLDKFMSYELSRESNWVGAVNYVRDPVVSDDGKELMIEFSLPDSYLLSNVFYEDLSKSSKGEYPTNLFWDRLIDDFVVQTRMN